MHQPHLPLSTKHSDKATHAMPPTALTGVHSDSSLTAALTQHPPPSAVVSNPITVRSPRTPAARSTLAPPAPAWLAGTWHVTHSSLPMWRKKRNVRITYAELDPSGGVRNTAARAVNSGPPHQHSQQRAPNGADASPARSPARGGPPPRLDDRVSYQNAGGGGREKVIRGVDTAEAGPDGVDGWAWRWRGRGWLAVAGSRWEVLGWGDELPAVGQGGRKGEANQWVVTYFDKTLFEPAGVDIYSRHPGGLGGDTLEEIWGALKQVDDAEVRRLAGEIFEVKMDTAAKR